MTAPDSPVDVVAAQVDRLGVHQVFGSPVQQGGTTLVPVAKVRADGGFGGRRPDRGGGFGFVARPAGAWAIGENGSVTWHPAVDMNRIVLGGQLALAAVLVATAVAAAGRRGVDRRTRARFRRGPG